jgi:hypothetical protein
MSNQTKEIDDSTADAINTECFENLLAEFHTHLMLFDRDITKLMRTKEYWEAKENLKHISARVNLLIKFADFIEYVGILQNKL